MKKIVIPLLLLSTGLSLPANAQDWAQLNTFQKANANLGTPGPNEARVVFMGNSITIGWLHAQPEFFNETPYINRGISGQTTAQMLVRFRQDVIALRPIAVVILAGTNDIAQNQGPVSLEQIMGNIKSMAELASANNIAVLLCSVLPAGEYSWRPGLNPARKIPALNKMIMDYCRAQNFTYVDYFSAMTDGKNALRPDLGSDGVHPNLKGYQLMGPILEAALQEIKNEK